MANDDLWNTCTCGREFATVDGFAAHKVSLHDAEPDPVENKINDDKIRAELDEAAAKNGTMANGSYPINNQTQANSAWKLRNHSKDYSEAAVVAHIRRRVKALGLTMPSSAS
jgi:hypothetical protein